MRTLLMPARTNILPLAAGILLIATGAWTADAQDASIPTPCRAFERDSWSGHEGGKLVLERDKLVVKELSELAGDFLAMGRWRVSSLNGQVIRATMFTHRQYEARIVAIVEGCGGERGLTAEGANRDRNGKVLETTFSASWRMQLASGLTAEVWYSHDTSCAFDHELTDLELEDPAVLTIRWSELQE